MTTTKQITANQQNALLSTGATTLEGKATVAKNAVKHGIFTNDLIIAQGDGIENQEDYIELHNNLIADLKPVGQMQHLLVELITVDTWRFRRALRFETGAIRQLSDNATYDYYHQDFPMTKPETDTELDKKIATHTQTKTAQLAQIEILRSYKVQFDNPVWSNDKAELDIEALLDSYIYTKRYELLNEAERYLYDNEELTFEQMLQAINNAGYYEQDIAELLIEQFETENSRLDKEIADLLRLKQNNQYAEDVNKKVFSLPNTENSEKIIRYTKAIQNSIYRNLELLKRLQAT